MQYTAWFQVVPSLATLLITGFNLYRMTQMQTESKKNHKESVLYHCRTHELLLKLDTRTQENHVEKLYKFDRLNDHIKGLEERMKGCGGKGPSWNYPLEREP